MSSTGKEGKLNDATVEDAGVAGSITKRQKLARNCKRFWWAWLAGFLIFVLIIVMIVIYGIIPPVAQKIINDTELTLHSLKITNSKADSFEVSINGTITGATGPAKHARLDAFSVKVFLEGHDPIQPFMTLPVDEIHGGSEVPVVQNNVEVSITDEAPLDEFASKLMDNDLLRVAMRGRTKMHLGAIHTGINYNEVVTLKALNHLQGMIITSYQLLQNQSDANLAGEVLIPNPSVVTIEMGNVGLTIALDNESYGTGVIPNLTLTPGNNTYGFRAQIEQSKLIPMALATGNGKPLTIGSNGTVIDGVKVPWLSKPLESLKTLVPIQRSSSG
ncbi:hypothetical protein FN846DRAFT_595791 [Sphaerosporella brunnea]|uniref:Uncharacterized protein n=1 Tax=Sphaerosporella brunnea TaxID=1250544 RepID=A0A5J5EDX0_9PEZI|nr:hypothetical protein FN846DRAFT_595791 [Sphaerosporella brunnea]